MGWIVEREKPKFDEMFYKLELTGGKASGTVVSMLCSEKHQQIFLHCRSGCQGGDDEVKSAKQGSDNLSL